MTSRSRFGLPSLFAVNASRFSPGRRPVRLSGTAICVIAPHAGEEAGTGGNATPERRRRLERGDGAGRATAERLRHADANGERAAAVGRTVGVAGRTVRAVGATARVRGEALVNQRGQGSALVLQVQRLSSGTTGGRGSSE